MDAHDHRIARLHHVEPAAQAHAHGLEALDVFMIPVDVADQPTLADVEPVRGNRLIGFGHLLGLDRLDRGVD